MEQDAKALARGLRSRDPELLDRLIEQYHYRLFRYLYHLTGSRETAEDLFQETWVRVLERGHQYDGNRKFESWLFAVARHLAIDLLRRKKAAGVFEESSESGDDKTIDQFPSCDRTSAFEAVARREESDRVQAALGRLRATYREVLVLRFQEDFALDEIAALVAAPLSTVKSRLYRGLAELRAALGVQG